MANRVRRVIRVLDKAATRTTYAVGAATIVGIGALAVWSLMNPTMCIVVMAMERVVADSIEAAMEAGA